MSKVEAAVGDADEYDLLSIPIPSKIITGGGSPELKNAGAAHPATTLTFPSFSGLHSGQWKNKDGDLDWSYTAECVKRWSSDALLMHLFSHAFSIPARDYNPAAPFVYVHLANDHDRGPDIIPLPHGYRLPLMFVGKYLWETILSSLSSAQESWDMEKLNLLHISRLCENTFARARVKATKSGMEKGWRCLIFDRFLARLYKHWIKNDSSSNADFLKLHGSKEYDRNVLRHDWKRWCLRGLHGVRITEAEVNSGITVDQYRKGLQRNRWTGIWMLDHKYPIFSVAEDRNSWNSEGEKGYYPSLVNIDKREKGTERRREISELVTSMPSKRDAVTQDDENRPAKRGRLIVSGAVSQDDENRPAKRGRYIVSGTVTQDDENRPAKRVRLIVSGTNQKPLGTLKSVPDINSPKTSLYHASSPPIFSVSRTGRGLSEGQVGIDNADVLNLGNNLAREISPDTPLTPREVVPTVIQGRRSRFPGASSLTASGDAVFSKPASSVHSLRPKFPASWNSSEVRGEDEASSQRGSESRTVENLTLSPKSSDGQRRIVGPILSSFASSLEPSKCSVWSVRSKYGRQPPEVARRHMNEDVSHRLELAHDTRGQNRTDLPSAYTDQKFELMRTDLLGVQSVTVEKGEPFSMDTSEGIWNQMNDSTEVVISSQMQQGNPMTELPLEIGGQSDVFSNDIAGNVGEVELGNSLGTVRKTMGRSEVGVQVEIVGDIKDRKDKATQVELGMEDGYSTTLQQMRQDDVETQKKRSSSSALVDNVVSAKMQSLMQTVNTLKGPLLQGQVISTSSRASAVTNSMIKDIFEELKVLHEEAQSRERRVKEEIKVMRQLHSAEVDALRRRLSYLESHCATQTNRGKVYEIERDETFFASQSDHRRIDKQSSYHAPTDGPHAHRFLNALVHSRNGVEDSLLPIKTQRKQHIASARAPS